MNIRDAKKVEAPQAISLTDIQKTESAVSTAKAVKATQEAVKEVILELSPEIIQDKAPIEASITAIQKDQANDIHNAEAIALAEEQERIRSEANRKATVVMPTLSPKGAYMCTSTIRHNGSKYDKGDMFPNADKTVLSSLIQSGAIKVVGGQLDEG